MTNTTNNTTRKINDEFTFELNGTTRRLRITKVTDKSIIYIYLEGPNTTTTWRNSYKEFEKLLVSFNAKPAN